jgi:hypothetical protein
MSLDQATKDLMDETTIKGIGKLMTEHPELMAVPSEWRATIFQAGVMVGMEVTIAVHKQKVDEVLGKTKNGK